jgi:hypothetical protein
VLSVEKMGKKRARGKLSSLALPLTLRILFNSPIHSF